MRECAGSFVIIQCFFQSWYIQKDKFNCLCLYPEQWTLLSGLMVCTFWTYIHPKCHFVPYFICSDIWYVSWEMKLFQLMLLPCQYTDCKLIASCTDPKSIVNLCLLFYWHESSHSPIIWTKKIVVLQLYLCVLNFWICSGSIFLI